MWYRRPENYHGMNVAVLGARFSGVDIAFELSKQANKVSTIYFVRFLSMVNMSNMGRFPL
jgi:cation diffusion facilitator CzcD-associated flavoprotein CzcO